MVSAGFPLKFASVILLFHDSILARTLCASLLIIRPVPPNDALLMNQGFLQAEDVMTAISICWYNIFSSCMIFWSAIPSI